MVLYGRNRVAEARGRRAPRKWFRLQILVRGERDGGEAEWKGLVVVIGSGKAADQHVAIDPEDFP